jgi:hypothetical protein
MFETDDGVRVNGFHLRDVVGRNITCEDGVTRKVEQISYSHRYAEKVLINEINEDETPGGAWVHALSLACQMHGDPLPTEEQKRHFNKIWKAMRFVPDEGQTMPGSIVTPGGIILGR